LALRAEEIEDPGIVDLDRDRVLVLRYQRGDQGAFDELYRRYYPRLHLYCQRRVHDQHVAEELAQESFLKALRAMPRFAGERRFYPWMTVIAQRLCIDHHRRSSRVEPSPEIDLGFVEADHDEIFAEVDRTHLDTAMARLAPRHREVLNLREQRGWTYHQIAEHLGVPVTTVEALLHRARKALKREFLAVSGGGRLASLPIVGWVVMRVGRLRTRFTGRTAHQFAPIAGSAAAGVAAVSLVLSPFGASSAPEPVMMTPAAAAPAAASSTPSSDVVITFADLGSTTTTISHATATKSTPKTAEPTVDAAVVQVYQGDDGVQQAKAENDQQPVQFEVPDLVDAGVNPVQTVNDVVGNLPGGKS